MNFQGSGDTLTEALGQVALQVDGEGDDSTQVIAQLVQADPPSPGNHTNHSSRDLDWQMRNATIPATIYLCSNVS